MTAAPLRIACAATLALFALPAAAPAHAEDGAWKVGSSYVIRFEKLDVSTAPGRAVLLAQVERSAAKLCEGVSTRAKRQACAAEAVKSAMAKFPGIAGTLQLARLERDGQQQAQR
jgi:UrcA family protein